MEVVDLKRTIYGKNTFSSVVDTDFKELLPPSEESQESGIKTVDDFFDSYNTLFYDIPLEGPNSHRELLERSGDYFGQPYSQLLEELESLKRENADLKNKMSTLSR